MHGLGFHPLGSDPRGWFFGGLTMTRSSEIGLGALHSFSVVYVASSLWGLLQLKCTLFALVGTLCRIIYRLLHFQTVHIILTARLQRFGGFDIEALNVVRSKFGFGTTMQWRGKYGVCSSHEFGFWVSRLTWLTIFLGCGAITTTVHILLCNHGCNDGRHLRDLLCVQPHVLDRWCVGCIASAMWVSVIVVFAMWLCFDFVPAKFRDAHVLSDRGSFGEKTRRHVGTDCCVHPRVVQLLVLMAFLHSGEAHNPGPDEVSGTSKSRCWSIGAFNPSGLGGKHQVISSYMSDCDIWAISETHLTSRGFASFRQSMHRSSSFSYCVSGAHVPLRQHSDRTGEWSGVCMISKHPTRQIPIRWPKSTYETSRVLLTSTLCSDLWVHGAVLYGEPAGLTHPDAAHNTDMIAHDLFRELHYIGGLRFFAGDFNFEQGGLDIFKTLEAAGYRDLQDLAFERWGIHPRHTCKSSTRKDFCYLSPDLQTFLVDIRHDDTIWADHAVLQGFFRGGQSDLVTHHWRIPAQVDWPSEMHCEIPPGWYQQSSPDSSYADLWKHIEETASLHCVANGKAGLPGRCRGRGQTTEVKLRKAPFRSGPLRPSRKGDVLPTFVGTSQQHAHWFRQLRRLQAYCRFRNVHATDCGNAHGPSLWSSILRAKGFNGGFFTWWENDGAKVFNAPTSLPLIPPDAKCAQLIYDSFMLDVRRLEQTLRSQQRKHAVDRRKELAHVIFQDIKRSSPDRVDVLLQVTTGHVLEIDHYNATLFVETSQALVSGTPIFINGVQQDVIYIHENEIWLPSVEGIEVGSEVRQSSFCGAARWDRHKGVPPSQWSQICEFARQNLHPIPCTLPGLNAQSLRVELSRKKKHCASGLDGVSLQDLKALPDAVLTAFCHVYDQAELTGAWPSQLVTGKVASLAKVQCPDNVQSFRPITVLSHGYRLWSGIRAKFVLAHLHPHCPSFLFGNRPHCQASDVWTFLSWAIESSFVSDEPVGGIVADIEKAFNHLPREVVFQTALALGLPQTLLVAWSGALGTLTRRFQIRNHIGPALDSCTGYPEGDALSCVAMLLMDILFHKWFECSYVLCQPVSYVDDLQLFTRRPSQVPELFDHLLSFARQVDLKVDARKTFVWSNSAYHRANYRHLAMKVQLNARGLGAQLQFTRKHSTVVISDRLRELEPLWKKLRLSVSPYKIKVLAVKQAAWTRGLHGVAASNVSDGTFTSLRTCVMKGLGAEGSGCSPVVHLGLIEHPNLDPQFWAISSTLRTVREASSADCLSALLKDALDPDTVMPRYSLTALLIDRLHLLGWSFEGGVSFSDALGTFSLLHISFPELLLRMTWAWTKVVESAVQHRSSFAGLGDCDPFATRRFLQTLPVARSRPIS